MLDSERLRTTETQVDSSHVGRDVPPDPQVTAPDDHGQRPTSDHDGAGSDQGSEPVRDREALRGAGGEGADSAHEEKPEKRSAHERREEANKMSDARRRQRYHLLRRLGHSSESARSASRCTERFTAAIEAAGESARAHADLASLGVRVVKPHRAPVRERYKAMRDAGVPAPVAAASCSSKLATARAIDAQKAKP